jgi:hypothetical protein
VAQRVQGFKKRFRDCLAVKEAPYGTVAYAISDLGGGERACERASDRPEDAIRHLTMERTLEETSDRSSVPKDLSYTKYTKSNNS